MVAESGSSGCYSVDYYRIAKCQDTTEGVADGKMQLYHLQGVASRKKESQMRACTPNLRIYVLCADVELLSCLPHSPLPGHRQARSIRHDPWDRVIGACFTSRAFRPGKTGATVIRMALGLHLPA